MKLQKLINTKSRRGFYKIPSTGIAGLIAFLLSAAPTLAQDLSHMSIDDLVAIDITSVSKMPEKISKTPAAVYVITNADIKRSAITNIWDALRLAPGVEVFKQAGDTVAVSIRTQNSYINDKVLFLQDGRALNDPFNNNVFWLFQDLVLDDIDRIEIIRGPAGVLWGENAVSGLVNVITKKSSETQGLLARAGGGNYERAFGTVRYGDKINVDTTYSTFLKSSSHASYDLVSGGSAHDGYDLVTGGLRIDSDVTEKDQAFFETAWTYGEADKQTITPAPGIEIIEPDVPESTTGYRDGVFGHVLGRWNHDLGEGSDLQLQAYYDHAGFDNLIQEFTRDTGDVDFQHHIKASDRDDVVWGAGYRLHSDDIKAAPGSGGTVDPESKTFGVFSSFVNTEYEVVEDTLKLSTGTKFTHNTFTGWELQPGARLAYFYDDITTVWGAYTRSVRTPARFENDFSRTFFVAPPEDEKSLPYVFGSKSSNNLDAVKTDSYEIGGRRQLAKNLNLDIATFITHTKDGLSFEDLPVEVNDTVNPPRLEENLEIQNNLTYEYYGAEVSIDYRPFESWRLVGNYTYLQGSASPQGDTTDICDHDPDHFPVYCTAQQTIPNNIFSLQSQYNVTDKISFDSFLEFIQGFDSSQFGDEGYTGSFEHVDSYVVLDVRLNWQVTDIVELSLIGQNLADSEHVEWQEQAIGEPAVDIGRSFLGQVTVKLN